MGHVQDRRSNGRGWVATWRDPQGKVQRKSFRLKADAEQFLTSTEHSKQVGDYVAPSAGRELFGARYEKWAATTVNLRPSTRARDESYARSLILPTFGKVPLAAINHDLVQGWVAELTAQGKAPATVGKAHQILSKVLASAVSNRVIARNPAADTRLPTVEREEQRFLVPAEVAKLAAAIDPSARALVLVGAYGGLRIGELLGLRVGRVDTMRATVQVAEIVTDVKGCPVFGPPKTRAGRRTVPLPRFVADELVPVIAGREPGALVFPDSVGGAMRANNFRRRLWLPAVSAAGLAPLRPHDLRHSAISFWIAAGANPLEVARRAGHASVTTVFDRYAHLLPREVDTLTDALDAMARAADALSPMGDTPATVTMLRPA